MADLAVGWWQRQALADGGASRRGVVTGWRRGGEWWRGDGAVSPLYVGTGRGRNGADGEVAAQ